VTALGIDPETSQLVAQCLNHYATPGPENINNIFKIKLLDEIGEEVFGSKISLK
jgi:hypothetical protein